MSLHRAATLVGLVALTACGSSEPSPPPPPPAAPTLGTRMGHALGYDEARRQAVLFGGLGADGSGADVLRQSLWTWNGAAWTASDATGPQGRVDAAFLWDAARSRMILLGGRTGLEPTSPALSDIWDWTGVAWAARTETTPTPRVHPAVAFDRIRNRIVIFAGFDPSTGTDLSDLWESSPTGSAPMTFTRTQATGPADTFAPEADFDAQAGVTWILVSKTSDRTILTYSWNGTSLSLVDDAGPKLVGYAIASRGAAGGLVLFGGSDGPSLPGDSWTWNGSHWTRLTVTGPSGRVGHAMTYDVARDRIVLFGGETQQGRLSDTWEFDGSTWRDVTPLP